MSQITFIAFLVVILLIAGLAWAVQYEKKRRKYIKQEKERFQKELTTVPDQVLAEFMRFLLEKKVNVNKQDRNWMIEVVQKERYARVMKKSDNPTQRCPKFKRPKMPTQGPVTPKTPDTLRDLRRTSDMDDMRRSYPNRYDSNMTDPLGPLNPFSPFNPLSPIYSIDNDAYDAPRQATTDYGGSSHFTPSEDSSRLHSDSTSSYDSSHHSSHDSSSSYDSGSSDSSSYDSGSSSSAD